MPRVAMSSAPTTVTGLALVRFGCGIREPVTTTSATSPAPWGWAWAWAARPNMAAPQIIEDASRRSRIEFTFKVCILQRPRGARADPHKKSGASLAVRRWADARERRSSA